MTIFSRPEDDTLLRLAVEEGIHLEMVKLLAEKRPKDVGERKQKTGKTVLHLATEMNNMEMVRVLCAANPQAASIQDYKDGDDDYKDKTPLHYAVEQDNLEMVKLLIEHNAQCISVQNSVGKTALHHYTEMNNMDMVRVLCAANPQAASVQDQQGRTAMHLACVKNNLEMVKCMCEASTLAISMQDEQRKTPLSIARSHERGRQTFDFLISVTEKYMAEPDGRGQMALHFICSSGFTDLFPDWLSRYPSALEKFDENGQSCLMAALNGHHLELARSIISKCSNATIYR